MRRNLLASAGVSLLLAAPAMGETFAERVVEQLAADGFRALEVKNGPTETKVEAIRGGTRLEVVYDRATGQIVEQEVEPFTGIAPPAGVIEISARDRDFSDLARDRAEDEDDDRDRQRGRGRDDRDDDDDRSGRDRDRGRDGDDDDGNDDSAGRDRDDDSSGRGRGRDDGDDGDDDSGHGRGSDRGEDDGEDGDDNSGRGGADD